MCAAWDSFSVRLPELARSTTFRWTLAVAGAFAICIILLFGFVYWQTAAYVTAQFDSAITEALTVLAAEAPERRLDLIDARLAEDPRRVRLAGLFSPNGRRITGNLESLPADLLADTVPQTAQVVRIDNGGREHQNVRAVARKLPNGDILVLGRNIDEIAGIAEIVGRALALGLLPALFLSGLTGVLLSLRAQKRVEEVNKRIQRIVAGDLRQRLPTQGIDDPFDKLAVMANGMLDEIEALIHKIAGVGDDIAHDLRTPLTRVRVSLERGRASAQSLESLQAVVDRAIGGLDQSLAIVTALLRIAEIEHTRRLAGFGDVALAELVREVADLYEPIAEDKGISLKIEIAGEAIVRGDRDLLLEAVANLVDNAVKFTPRDGTVEIALIRRDGESIVRIKDTGPGISDDEREAVVRRFYRSDKSRHTQGLGLGLSLVNAIIKLHGFRWTIIPGPGCVVEIAIPHPQS
jgi:signal transduction histidine kinase